MSNDLVADLLTRIRNAQRAGHKSVKVQVSKFSQQVLSVLKAEGFIDGYETKKAEKESHPSCTVHLKYYDSGEPVIGLAQRVSKSGRRMYAQTTKLPRVQSGLGISIVSTSQGVMSDREAKKRKIGGEVLALIG